MEGFLCFVQEQWLRIVEWAGIFVSYFLMFFYRGNLLSAKDNLLLAFKQFSARFSDNEKAMQKELDESKGAYFAAVTKIEKLTMRIEALEASVALLSSDDTEVIDDIQYEDGD